METWQKVLLGVGGAAVVGGAGYIVYKRSKTIVADPGMGADVVASSADPGLMLIGKMCLGFGEPCTPGVDVCCQSTGPHGKNDFYTIKCRRGGKFYNQGPYKCREVTGSTQAKKPGEQAPPEGQPGYVFGAGGDIRVKIPKPRYIVAWTNKDGDKALMDLSHDEACDLVYAIQTAAGGETTLPCCSTGSPTYHFYLLPMSPGMLPDAALSSIFDAVNGVGDLDDIKNYAVKEATVTAGLMSNVLFKDLLPGKYFLYNGSSGGAYVNKTIGVENFGNKIGDALGNAYSMLSNYLGGSLDFSSVTVRLHCGVGPEYMVVNTKSRGGTKVYTYPGYRKLQIFEGDQSDAAEWAQDVANDIGNYISDKVSGFFG